MNVFRRASSAGSSDGMVVGRKIAFPGEQDVPSRTDNGPVLVAVDGSLHGWDALEWAAAEAGARRSDLRIVHVTSWAPQVWGDGYTTSFVNEWDSGALASAKSVLEEAVRRACAVEPGLSATTHVHEGPAGAAVLSEGKRDALIVVGRGQRRGRFSMFSTSVSRQVVRRAAAPVVVVELFDNQTRGPSARRVVVSVDWTTEPLTVLGFAFRAALRRGIGLTVLHASGKFRSREEVGEAITAEWLEWHQALHLCRQTFPDVDVRQRLVEGPAAPALLSEAVGAALVVIGSETCWRRHGMLAESGRESVWRTARSPVAIVSCRP